MYISEKGVIKLGSVAEVPPRDTPMNTVSEVYEEGGHVKGLAWLVGTCILEMTGTQSLADWGERGVIALWRKAIRFLSSSGCSPEMIDYVCRCLDSGMYCPVSLNSLMLVRALSKSDS